MLRIKGSEAAIIGDYDVQTAVERGLVLRLASLLWRIRRATSIETDLLRIQAEILHDRWNDAEGARQSEQPHHMLFRVLSAAIPRQSRGSANRGPCNADDVRPIGLPRNFWHARETRLGS